MSEMTVTIPVSMFGAVPLDDIISGIKNADEMQRKNTELTKRVEVLKSSLAQIAADLTHVINADVDVMAKFQELRHLSTAINGMIRDQQ